MNAELRAIVEQARAIKACESGIAEAEKFGSVEEILASEHGPKFAAWYAMRVRKAATPEYESIIQRDPNVWKMYSAWLESKS